MTKKTPSNSLQTTEQRLQESEENFRILFDQNPMPTILSEIPSGKIAFVNKRFAEIVGMDIGAVVGKTAVELGLLKNPADMQKLTDLIMSQGYVDNIEVEKIFPGGGQSGTDLVSMRIITMAGKRYSLVVVQDISDRKQMENTLRESEEKYRKIFENSVEGIFQVTPDGRFLSANPALARSLGYESTEELTGTISNIGTQIYKDSTDRETFHDQIAEKGFVKNFTVECRKKDGSSVWIEFNAKIVSDKNGKILYYEGMGQDVTERRRSEQRLQESEGRFQKIIENAPIAMAIVSMDGVIEYINEKAIKVFGYLPEDIPTMDRWWVQAYPDEKYRNEVVADWTGRIRKALTIGGEIAGNEYRATCKDGAIKTMFISGVPVGGKIFVLFDDITWRKQAEQQLRESEERFSKAFKVSPYAYLIANMEDGRIVEVNDAFTAFSGFTREEALAGSTISLNVWVVEKDRERMVAAVRDSGAIVGMETRLRAKNGEIRTVLLSARAIRLGNKPCLLSIVEDIYERKLAEESLKKSEAQYRSLVETTDTGYVIINEKGCVLDANKEYVRLSGHKNLGEILGRCVMEWTAAEEKEKNAAAVAECLKTGAIRNLEIAYVDKAGKRTSVEINATKIEMEGKQKILSLCRDITERILTEEALRLRESYLSAIIENQPGLLWMKDRDGRFLAVNTKFSNSCGLDNPDSLIGKTDFDIWPHELAAGYTADDNKVVKSGTPYIVEEPISDKGEIRWFETFKAPIFDKKGMVLGTTGFSRDITERKQSEERWKQTASLLRATLESTADGILVVDLAGKVASYNKKFGELWRIPQRVLDTGDDEKLLSFILDQLKNPDAFIDKVKELYSNPDQVSFDTIEFNDGRFFERYSQPHRVDETIVGRVWSFRDITERKRTEEELQKAQKLESLGVLAGGIAHDFNNLLAGIFGYLDLARSISTEAQVTEYLETTLSSMNRARALTLQLLTFAKGGAPVQKITPLVPFLQDSVHFALSGSNISCRFFVDDDLWSCNIDRNQIGQVLDNIVINAQQAMPSGGTVEITAKNVSIGEKEYPLLAGGDYVKVSIRDFGIGIPKDILPRIFDPFYTTKTKGHGLGLATCYSIINRHRGCIAVESEPGKGSTFHVFLPASKDTAMANDPAVASHRGSGTIVVMDDEEAIRTTVKKMLESKGYSVECKKDGREAIDFYLNETGSGRPVAAMIFDLTIPGGMGGVEAVAEVRKLNAGAEVPVFVVSGYAENDAMKNPARYGFTASLCKPFAIAELLEMLDKYLRK